MPHDHHDHPYTLLPPEPELRLRALETALVFKGLVDPEAIEALIALYETEIGPQNGARVIARAWVDPAYRARLLEDGTVAMAELGFQGRQSEHMVAVENTPAIHNLVVCTLCSCYPWAILGIPPTWYKSDAYRARAVRDPRGVLSDFGVILPEHKDICVWDSTAEMRYLVIPERPVGTEDWSEEALAGLVTRNSMIGTDLLAAPKAQP